MQQALQRPVVAPLVVLAPRRKIVYTHAPRVLGLFRRGCCEKTIAFEREDLCEEADSGTHHAEEIEDCTGPTRAINARCSRDYSSTAEYRWTPKSEDSNKHRRRV